MGSEPSDTVPLSDRFAQLERAFIDEFLRLQGFDHVTVNTLPDAQRHAMLTSASTYAATKLAETPVTIAALRSAWQGDRGDPGSRCAASCRPSACGRRKRWRRSDRSRRVRHPRASRTLACARRPAIRPA